MTRIALRVAMLATAVGVGWAIGNAQTSQPDFELVVDAPAGETTVECLRGCELAWVERGLNPATKPQASFEFKCGGPIQQRCSSFRIGGWIKR